MASDEADDAILRLQYDWKSVYGEVTVSPQMLAMHKAAQNELAEAVVADLAELLSDPIRDLEEQIRKSQETLDRAKAMIEWVHGLRS